MTVKGYAIGDFEGYYGSDVAFYELANGINRFEGFREKMKREPVQSFWTFTIEMGVGIHARDMGKVTRWGDLDGVRVFTGPRPWDTRAQLERAFKVLGINHEYIEVSVKTAGSLLEQGRFVALGVYTNAEASTAPWIQEASLQADWASLSPDAGELDKLAGAGFKVVEVDTSVFGKKKTHADKAAMLPFFYGLHLGMDVSEEDMYRILLAAEANVDELAQADKAFKQIQRGHAPDAAPRRRGGGRPGPGSPRSCEVHARERGLGREVGFAHRELSLRPAHRSGRHPRRPLPAFGIRPALMLPASAPRVSAPCHGREGGLRKPPARLRPCGERDARVPGTASPRGRGLVPIRCGREGCRGKASRAGGEEPAPPAPWRAGTPVPSNGGLRGRGPASCLGRSGADHEGSTTASRRR